MRMPVHLDSQMTFEIRIMRRCERVAGAQHNFKHVTAILQVLERFEIFWDQGLSLDPV